MSVKHFLGVLLLLFVFTATAHTQQTTSIPPSSFDLALPCPSDEPCVILTLTKTELNVLTAETGILATAAQARNLDLGQYVAYFRQKIALAPAGKNQPKPDEKKGEEAPKKP